MDSEWHWQIVCLEYLVKLGMGWMIVMGPTTLEIPRNALSIGNFHVIAAIVGVILPLGMQMIKESSAVNEKENKNTRLKSAL